MSKVMPAANDVACFRCRKRMAIYMFAVHKGWRRVCKKCLRGEERRRLTRFPNQHQYKEKDDAREETGVR